MNYGINISKTYIIGQHQNRLEIFRTDHQLRRFLNMIVGKNRPFQLGHGFRLLFLIRIFMYILGEEKIIVRHLYDHLKNH